MKDKILHLYELALHPISWSEIFILEMQYVCIRENTSDKADIKCKCLTQLPILVDDSMEP